VSTCKTCRSRVAVVLDYPHAKSFYGPLVRAMRRRFNVTPIPRSRAAALQGWDLVVFPFRDWAVPGSFVVDHAPLLGNRCTLQAQDFEVWSSLGVERAAGVWGVGARVASWPIGFFFMDQLDFGTYRPDVALAYFANREPRIDVAGTLRVLCQRFARVLYCFHVMDPGWDVPVVADNLKRVKHGPAFWAALGQAGTVLCDYSSVVTVALGDPRKRLYSHQAMPRPGHAAARFFNRVVQRIAYTYTEDSLGRLLDEPDTRTRVRQRWARWVHGPGLGKGATERVVGAMEQAIRLRREGTCTGQPIRAILGGDPCKGGEHEPR